MPTPMPTPTPAPEPARRTLTTRLLHGALLVSVLWQLIGSNFIERPRATQPGNGLFEVHEVVGLVTLALVVAFWLWAAVRRRETAFGALCPWGSATRLKAIGADLGQHWAQIKQRRLPGFHFGNGALQGCGHVTWLVDRAFGVPAHAARQ